MVPVHTSRRRRKVESVVSHGPLASVASAAAYKSGMFHGLVSIEKYHTQPQLITCSMVKHILDINAFLYDPGLAFYSRLPESRMYGCKGSACKQIIIYFTATKLESQTQLNIDRFKCMSGSIW